MLFSKVKLVISTVSVVSFEKRVKTSQLYYLQLEENLPSMFFATANLFSSFCNFLQEFWKQEENHTIELSSNILLVMQGLLKTEERKSN